MWFNDKTYVIKEQNIEKVKTFLEAFGLKFQQEKHNDGLKHYSCQVGDKVLEIYPKITTYESALIYWAQAFALAEENPSLLIASSTQATSDLCTARMWKLEQTFSQVLAYRPISEHHDGVLTNLADFVKAESDKGCGTCWITSGPMPHDECGEKIANWFAAREKLYQQGKELVTKYG